MTSSPSFLSKVKEHCILKDMAAENDSKARSTPQEILAHERVDAHKNLEGYSTPEVRIRTETMPLMYQSNPDKRLYAHQYTVSIENCSKETIKLLNRHWKVFSASKQIADIKGEGVVGEQPVLFPRQEFFYTSWTTVIDNIGHMQGVYTFYCERSGFFDIQVPRFDLIFVDTNLPQ